MQCRTPITSTGSGGGLATWETVRLLDSVSRFPLLVLPFARGNPAPIARPVRPLLPHVGTRGRGLATASPRPTERDRGQRGRVLRRQTPTSRSSQVGTELWKSSRDCLELRVELPLSVLSWWTVSPTPRGA